MFIVLASMGFISPNPAYQGSPETLCRKRKGGFMRTRNNEFHLWMNDEEFSKLDDLSHKSGLSFSVILRNFIMGYEVRERPSADFLVLSRSFDKIGANINQIARKANKEDIASAAELKELNRLLREMHREMKDWKKTWQ